MSPRLAYLDNLKAPLSVGAGESITIARAGKPVADLVPHSRAVLLWAMDNSDRLGLRTRAHLLDPPNTSYVSAATIWELQLKRALPHRDPFDRILLAQALTDELTFLAVHRFLLVTP